MRLGIAVLGVAMRVAAPADALVTIDWVEVGDPGNASASATNCYAVDCSDPRAGRVPPVLPSSAATSFGLRLQTSALVM